MIIVTYQKLLAFSKIIHWLIFTAVPHITPVSVVTKLNDITQIYFPLNLYIDLSTHKIKFVFKAPLNIKLLKKCSGHNQIKFKVSELYGPWD